ncbi:MAG: ABC transporter permease [Gemmatimonadetes bacterium]|nr:ABC transporter permease [Gemmatimonadota bacterium]MYF75363.1 ABC transporter permease [Gemmatimonadota bacterium]MYK54688.1 ABC transporter permease [Gemmatimonadota bacterium]
MSWILIKLAWKNLLRHKRRSIIAATAMGIGLAALIFADALWLGMEHNMVKTATASFLGDGQIHREGFSDEQAVELTINQLDAVVANLRREGIVAHFTLRTFAFGMITSPATVAAVNLVGVEPSTERYLSQIDDAIIEGAYFEGSNLRDIVMGEELVERLEVGLNDRVVVTMAQAGSGDLSQEMFRVSGIYRFADEGMNSGMAFIRLGKAQQMLALGAGAHEIALKFIDSISAEDQNLLFWKTYSQGGNKARSWTEVLPEVQAMFEMSKFSKYIMGFVLFGVVVFGIVNTLFMSLYERMFEFGVLRAIGTRPFGMARLILFEAGALAVLGIILGTIFGFCVTLIFSTIGIDYTGIEMMGITMQELIYPEMRIQPFIFYSIWIFVFTIIAGLYPARYAAKMSAATAMRRSF